MLRRWHLRAQFEKALPARLVKMRYGGSLREALSEWRANIEGPKQAKAA